MVELLPSFSMSTGCVMPLRGYWAHFHHAGPGQDGRVWSASGKSLETFRHGQELKSSPHAGRTDHEIHSFSHWPIGTDSGLIKPANNLRTLSQSYIQRPFIEKMRSCGPVSMPTSVRYPQRIAQSKWELSTHFCSSLNIDRTTSKDPELGSVV